MLEPFERLERGHPGRLYDVFCRRPITDPNAGDAEEACFVRPDDLRKSTLVAASKRLQNFRVRRTGIHALATISEDTL